MSLTKYSYYESGAKWIKVLLEFKNIKSHPKELVTCEFKPRTFTLKVLDFKGTNFQFTVPKTQCSMKPEECSISFKTDSI